MLISFSFLQLAWELMFCLARLAQSLVRTFKSRFNSYLALFWDVIKMDRTTSYFNPLLFMSSVHVTVFVTM